MYNDRDWYDKFNGFYSSRMIGNETNRHKSPINPIYVGFKVTEKCNQHCKHCWAGKSIIEKSLIDITTAFDKLRAFNVFHMTITGGEPFLRNDCFDIITYAKKTFPVVEIFTNAVLLDDNIISKLKDILTKHDFFQVSLDGLRNSYMLQRGTDSYYTVLENIKKLVVSGMNVRVNMTATSYNLNDIVNVYNKCVEMGCHTFSISYVVPIRKGKDVRVLTSIEKYGKIIKELEAQHNKNDNKITLRTFIPIEIKSVQAKQNYNEKTTFFNDNILHWTIDAEGNIYNFLDHYLHPELKIGNIYMDDIEIINESNFSVQKKILYRSFDKEKCARCSLLNSCQGGSYIENYPNINIADRRCLANV